MRQWKRFDELPRRFLRAYERNAAERPDFSENRLPNGALVFQNGGAFTGLRYRRVNMSNVCCGIMAAYNAMILGGLSEQDVDFLKLAAEFEYGAAVPAIPSGLFGNNPWRIVRCFSAYGFRSERYRSLAMFENALTAGKVGVLSYKFGKLDPRIHIFAVQRTENGVVAYNHYSGMREPEIGSSVAEILKPKNVFLIGDVLERAE